MLNRLTWLASFALIFPLIGCSKDPAAAKLIVNTSLSSTTTSRFFELNPLGRIPRDCDRMPCAGSPESMTLKLYKVYVSEHADCTSPVEVADHGTAGKDVVLGSDKLIEVSPADGTYPCLILKMSDNLQFVPDAEAVGAHTHCHTAATSVFDIYRNDNGGGGFKDLDGNAIPVSGTSSAPGDDTVFMYASATPADVVSGALAADINQTIQLTGALVVPGQTTFYADFSGGIADNGSLCIIEGGSGLGFK